MNTRIKAIRKKEKLTQEAFGKALNVSKSTIEAIEYGRRIPTERTIADICRIFQINQEWLLTGSGKMEEEATKEEDLLRMFSQLTEEHQDLVLKLAEELKKASP